jgi:hypothetical protein
MKLTDFDKKDYAAKALKENYKVSFDVSKMTLPEVKMMLQKVRALAMEAKQDKDFYTESSKPSYMKLVFMEQALVSHHNELMARPQPRIVIENEEVEKSQVVLAAQDMVDSIQKMVEDVSDMLVKELPALVNSIQSEMGVNESEQFNNQATEALTSLQTALSQSKASMQGALNTITGQGAQPDAFAAPDMGADMGSEEEVDLDVSDDEMAELPEPDLEPEEPEVGPVGGAGREKR